MEDSNNMESNMIDISYQTVDGYTRTAKILSGLVRFLKVKNIREDSEHGIVLDTEKVSSTKE